MNQETVVSQDTDQVDQLGDQITAVVDFNF